MVCSSSVSLGNRQNFILYQNDRNSWSYVAGPSQIGEGVALISVGGSPRNNVVGSAMDGSGVYWFKYPGSRNGVWEPHYIGSANAGVSIGSGTLPNGQSPSSRRTQIRPNPGTPPRSTRAIGPSISSAWGRLMAARTSWPRSRSRHA